MKYTFLPILSLVILLISACANSASKTESVNQTAALEAMRKEVMAVHDQIMPMMMGRGELVVLQQNLKLSLDSLNQAGVPAEVAKPYEEAIQNLKLAQQKMNVWMDGYKDPDYAKPDSATAYYQDQLKQIQAVSDLTTESMATAKKLLTE